MKKIIIILSLVFLSGRILGMGVITEVLFQGMTGSKTQVSTSLRADLFVDLLEQEDVMADLHYQIDDHKSRLNTAKVKFIFDNLDIVLGRQLLGWGSGYNFNPTDVINAKPLGAAFDPVYIKTGRDAVLLAYYPSGAVTAEFVFAPQYNRVSYMDSETTITENGKQDFGVRLKTHVNDFDIAFVYVNVGQRMFNAVNEPEDDLLGVYFKGTLPILEWGVWAEYARYLDQSGHELVCGFDYTYENYYFNIEYYRNGFGAVNKHYYNMDLVTRGRLLARDYLVPSLAVIVDEKLSATLFSFINMNDSSAILGGVLDYFYNDQVEIILTPYVLLGDTDTEYGIQADASGGIGVQGAVKVAL
ncbi:hypothetical protein ACFL96_18295 [Thermoproteota archaeon]